VRYKLSILRSTSALPGWNQEVAATSAFPGWNQEAAAPTLGEGEREKEIYLKEIYFQKIPFEKYPHSFVGTLQPLYANWKGRPRCVYCFSLIYTFLCLASPRIKSPGPQMKDQELGEVFTPSTSVHTQPFPAAPF